MHMHLKGWYGLGMVGARADAEAVGATTLGATRLGLQHKLELRAVDNLEPLDVAAMQHRVLVALEFGVAEHITLDRHLAVYVESSARSVRRDSSDMHSEW